MADLRRVTQIIEEADANLEDEVLRRVTQVIVEADTNLGDEVLRRVTQMLLEVDFEELPPPPPPPPVPPFRPHAGQHGISMSVFKPRITLAP